MFGKKKQGEATSEKPAKKKKAKKSKGKSTEGQSRFGDGGIKLMLAKNIEKIGLAAVVATALYVVFSSYKTPGLAESKQPSQLVTAISNAERNIDSASWDQEAQSRYLSPDNYEAKATEDVAPVNPMDYPLTQPLEPVKHGLPKLRSDVELLALEDLEVITGFGPIAIPPKQIAQTARLGEERQTYDEADERVLRDLPDEVAGMMGKTFSAPPESKLEARQFVCVTGLIPLKKQYEKYRKAFQDANGYNFERDFPVYTREFRVERAEVGSDGQLAPYVLIWGAESGKKRSPQEKKLRRELAKYCFKLPMEETVRQDALDPARMWSHPLPALTHRDLSAFKHSKIETQMDLEQKMLTQDMNMNSQTAGDPFARPTGMQGGYGGSSDGGGYSSGYGGGGGGYGSAYGGGGGGYGSAYGGGGGGGGGYGSAYGGGGAAPGSGYGGGGYGGGGYGGRGGSSSDGGGGYGGGGYGGGGGGQVTFDENDNAILSIDEKMFRFFDFTAMPGKAYRYRVQLALEDPNYPLDPSMAPRAKHIDANVTARLTHQAEAKPEGVDRIYWRLAEWSAPSPMVSLGRTERILAGEVKPALKGRATVNGKSVFFPKASSDKPQISAIVVGFDKEHNGDIPGTATLRLGSVANFRGSKVEMVDPKLMMLRMKDKHEFRSDMLVLDIIGGDELPSRKGETKLKAPGEMLVFTSSGQLEVHSEIEESSQFSYNTFPAADPTNSPYGDAYGSDDDDKKNRRRRGRGRGGYGGGGY